MVFFIYLDVEDLNFSNNIRKILVFVIVIIFDENSPAYLLDRNKPDIYTKGADYTMDNLPEAPVVIKNNIEVHFINFVEGKSTTNILNKIRQN